MGSMHIVALNAISVKSKASTRIQELRLWTITHHKFRDLIKVDDVIRNYATTIEYVQQSQGCPLQATCYLIAYCA